MSDELLERLDKRGTDLCRHAAARIRTQARRIEELEKALTWVLPMAKGWAAQHPVGSNANIVLAAERILRSAETKEES